MQILLSPAKDMTDEPVVAAPSLSSPRFLAEAEHNAAQMAELSTEELAQLLKINPQLAALNSNATRIFQHSLRKLRCFPTREWLIVTSAQAIFLPKTLLMRNSICG